MGRVPTAYEPIHLRARGHGVGHFMATFTKKRKRKSKAKSKVWLGNRDEMQKQ
jgi:hypothetical protein